MNCTDTTMVFGWEDYSLLAFMLISSMAIGLFYGWLGGRKGAEGGGTAEDFLLGGNSMSTAPVSLSLAASFITAIELLGNPAEMYTYGTQFWLICIPFLIVAPIAAYFYVPVFHALHLTSAYEYLEMRFNVWVRVAAAVLFVIQMSLYTSVAVFAPALALSHVTGFNVYLAVFLVYAVCIVYASQGGMKAVMMTDTFQAFILVLSIFVVLISGLIWQGGFENIWEISYETHRIEFLNMDPNPTVRHSFWSVVIGGSFYWATMFCANQASIQKCLSVQTMAQARTAIWVSAISLIVIFSINFLTGMIMYANYSDCDPLMKGTITASDQLLPLYVMDTLGKWPGVPGLFVAGIFCASLGTVAAALNSLAAVTVKDFIMRACNRTPSPENGARIGKYVSLGFGLLSFALVFVVERLGSVLQIALSFNGMVGGVTLGMFSLGMFFPWANTKGALVGSIVAFATVMWIGIGAQVEMIQGNIVYETKETSIDGCKCLNVTDPSFVTTLTPSPSEHDETLGIYRLSYLWYSMVGCLLTVIVGLIVSLLTGPGEAEDLDPKLLSPPVWSLLNGLSPRLQKRLKVPSEGTSQRLSNDFKMAPSYVIGIDNPSLSMNDEKTKNEVKTRY